ncbi:hypothetical protein ACFY8C_27375 [Streptomyces flavochromogenes]|uniref:PqqD family protein n=1 Tax=Streptomyces flavochromogenes TaxID=68199 RepID=A0ABW6XWY3_9ACTN|nr:hypothetical protein [Streptomyces flavochromogenes]
MPWVLPRTVHVVHDDTAGAALLDERSGRWYHLSRPGASLLKAILAGADPEAAAAEAAAVSGDDASRSDRAFLALFHDLRVAGLLIRQPAVPARRRWPFTGLLTGRTGR